MTAALVAWVRTLIGLSVVGAVVDFVLPDGGVKRYAGLVVGLCLTAALVAPLAEWAAAFPRRFQVSTWWMEKPPASVNAALWRQQAHDVAAVLETLPGVRAVAVHQPTSTQVVLAVTVAPAEAGPVREAAQNALHALMPAAPWHLRLLSPSGGEHARG